MRQNVLFKIISVTLTAYILIILVLKYERQSLNRYKLTQVIKATPKPFIKSTKLVSTTVSGASSPNESSSFTRQRPHTSEFSASFDFDVNGIAVQRINYDSFQIRMPNFGDSDSEKLFYKNAANIQFVGQQPEEKLKGAIIFAKNGTFDVRKDCGYKSKPDWIIQNDDRNAVRETRWFPVLVPLVVPDGWSFQHFLDGTLPKLIQSLNVIKQSNAFIFLEKPRDHIIYDFFYRLGISRDKLVFKRPEEQIVGAELLIFSCIAPPLHPLLWQRARSLLGAPEVLPVNKQDGYVILLTRTGCINCGRRLVNTDEVIELLHTRYGTELVKLFKGPLALDDTIDMFGSARLVIGTHGGGFYNINFAPAETTVIEVMPTKRDGSFFAAADQIIWAQASLLDQQYWRISSEPINDVGDVSLNTDVFEKVLNLVDKP